MSKFDFLFPSDAEIKATTRKLTLVLIIWSIIVIYAISIIAIATYEFTGSYECRKDLPADYKCERTYIKVPKKGYNE